MRRMVPAPLLILVLSGGCPMAETPSTDTTPETTETPTDTTPDFTARPSTLSDDVAFVALTGGQVILPDDDAVVDPDLPPGFVSTVVFSRTFPGTTAAAARRFALGDLQRTPLTTDFNGDGQPDFTIANGAGTGVVQIFMSQGAADDFDFLSLSLDRPLFGTIFFPDMTGIKDVAIGDIDNDGFFDVVVPGDEGVFYLHHPNGTHPTEGRPLTTTDLRYWNVSHIDGTTTIQKSDPPAANDFLPSDFAFSQLFVMLGLGPDGCDFGFGFTATIDNQFNRVSLGDIDNDDDLDIVVSQEWTVSIQSIVVLEATDENGVPVLNPVTGDPVLVRSTVPCFQENNISFIWILLNPGNDVVGVGWEFVRLGVDERAGRLDDQQPPLADRNTSIGLFLIDMDNDGDLDIINAASGDNDVQVAWFENPGAATVATANWVQWRVGSIRGATSVDVADVTGDGRRDVVIVSPAQAEVFLFVQPSTGPKREFDWDGNAILSSASGGPTDVRIADIDGDGMVELIVGEDGGSLYYLERPPGDPTDEWLRIGIESVSPTGSIGLLGAADFDGDNDLDLVIAVDAADDNDDRVLIIENVPQIAE